MDDSEPRCPSCTIVGRTFFTCSEPNCNNKWCEHCQHMHSRDGKCLDHWRESWGDSDHKEMNPIIQFVLGIIGLGVFLLFAKGFQIMAEEEGIGSAIGFFCCGLPFFAVLALSLGGAGGGGGGDGGGGSRITTHYNMTTGQIEHKYKLK